MLSWERLTATLNDERGRMRRSALRVSYRSAHHLQLICFFGPAGRTAREYEQQLQENMNNCCPSHSKSLRIAGVDGRVVFMMSDG